MDSVIRTLIDYQNSRVATNPLSVEKLLEIGETVPSNIVIFCSEIAIQTINEIQQVSKYFPVIYIFKKGHGVFPNLQEFLYYPRALELLLSESKETAADLECQQKNDEENMSQQQTGNKNDPNKRSYTGQPSIVSLFPRFIDTTVEFIKQHSFSAHNRRREDTCYSSRVTIPQIQSHLLEKVPGLKSHGISLSITRRLLEAPTKRNKPHARYKNYIEALVGVNNNCYREYHEDSHYLFGRNKQRRELASLLKDEIAIISTDDIARVKVGVVSFLFIKFISVLETNT